MRYGRGMVEIDDKTRNALNRRFLTGGIVMLVLLLGAAVTSFLISLHAVKPIRAAYLAAEVSAVQTMRAQNIATQLGQLTAPTKLKSFFDLRNDLAADLNLLITDNMNLVAGSEEMGLLPAGDAAPFFTDAGQGLNDQIADLSARIEAGFLKDLKSADPDEAAELVRVIRYDLNPQLRALLHFHSDIATRRINMMTFYQVIALAVLVISTLLAWALIHMRLAGVVKATLTPVVEDANDPATRTYAMGSGLPNMTFLRERLMDEVMTLKDTENIAVVAHLRFPGLDDLAPLDDRKARRAVQRDLFLALNSLLRPGDTVAHLTDNSFAISLGNIGDIAEAEPTLRAIIAHFAEPVRFADRSSNLRLSMGVGSLTKSDRMPEKALNNAAKVQAAAQKNGVGPVLMEHRALPLNAKLPEFLSTGLQKALEDETVTPVFVPVHDSAAGRARHIQAGGQWMHPKLGQVSSIYFDTIVSSCNLDLPVIEALLGSIAAAKAQWNAANIGIAQVSMRLSRTALIDPQTIETLRWALDSAELPPDQIAIEIDDFLLADSQCDEPIAALAAHGTPIFARDHCCEDFDLSMRKKRGVGGLILQRAGIANIDSSAARRRLTAAKITNAGKFDTRVIVEDVTTPAELAILRNIGVTQFQGPLIARPMSDGDILANLDLLGQRAQAI